MPPKTTWPILGIILLLAAWIRILPAGRVFPAQGDASHFVQHGVAYHYGDISDISGYWSIGPQFIAAWATQTGLNPARTLQATTIMAGIFLVLGLAVFAKTLTGRSTASWFAAALAASAPILVDSATTGLSETPHMALAIWGFALCHHALKSGKSGWMPLGMGCFGLDLYYRPYDLIILLGAFIPYMVISFRRFRSPATIRGLATGVVVLIAIGIPFSSITKAKQTNTAGSSKLVNLAFADYGLDAKAMWATKGIQAANSPLSKEIKRLQDMGAARYLWTNRERIARRYIANLLKAGRHMNDYAFAGAWRMGFGWFALLTALCAFGAVRGGMGRPALYSLASAGIVPLALSVGFIHPRWIMQCMPFYFLLMGMAMAHGTNLLVSRRTRATALGVFLLFVLLNARWAVLRLDDRWRDLNIPEVAENMRTYASDNDKLMCFGPDLPISFFRTNVMNYLEIPYGPVNEVAQWADLNKVDVIVLCSSRFPHFPIHEIAENPSLVPENWTEIDRLDFEKETRFGLESDQFLIYRRDKPR